MVLETTISRRALPHLASFNPRLNFMLYVAYKRRRCPARFEMRSLRIPRWVFGIGGFLASSTVFAGFVEPLEVPKMLSRRQNEPRQK